VEGCREAVPDIEVGGSIIPSAEIALAPLTTSLEELSSEWEKL